MLYLFMNTHYIYVPVLIVYFDLVLNNIISSVYGTSLSLRLYARSCKASDIIKTALVNYDVK